MAKSSWWAVFCFHSSSCSHSVPLSNTRLSSLELEILTGIEGGMVGFLGIFLVVNMDTGLRASSSVGSSLVL